jgi:hypothetical protein
MIIFRSGRAAIDAAKWPSRTFATAIATRCDGMRLDGQTSTCVQRVANRTGRHGRCSGEAAPTEAAMRRMMILVGAAVLGLMGCGSNAESSDGESPAGSQEESNASKKYCSFKMKGISRCSGDSHTDPGTWSQQCDERDECKDDVSTHCYGGCCTTVQILGAMWVASCTSSGGGGGSNPTSACTAGQQQCSGTSLQKCVNGAWQTSTCVELCKAAGYDTFDSCGRDSSGKDVCLCKNVVLGIGDPCTANSQCSSGICGGWCSAACSWESDCDGRYSSGKNANGFYNACIKSTAGQFYCFPRCNATSDCAKYPGTTCKSATNTLNQMFKICSL